MTANSLLGTADPALHPLYTEAHGNGPYDITIAVALAKTHVRSLDRNTKLLARFTGARYRIDNNPVTVWNISVTGDATDFEHSRSYYAAAEFAFATHTDQIEGEAIYLGVLTSAHLYPNGTDPLTQGDRDTPARMCTECSYGYAPHPLTAYLPPERDDINALIGSYVRVVVTPRGYSLDSEPAPA